MKDDDAAQVVIPIGEHVVNVPPEIAKSAATPMHLDGTRVWLRRNGAQLIVHLGDVDAVSLD